MSEGAILFRCDISARVLVKSTKVLRPSSALSRRIVRCERGARLLVSEGEAAASSGGVAGGLKDGWFGARRESVGFFVGPK